MSDSYQDELFYWRSVERERERDDMILAEWKIIPYRAVQTEATPSIRECKHVFALSSPENSGSTLQYKMNRDHAANRDLPSVRTSASPAPNAIDSTATDRATDV